MKDFLVSVIVPNYNHAQYLEQRLDTVFNQTYKNFEVIILDDCSTDNSIEIINRYKDNPHLSKIVVNEKNTGSPFLQWDKGIHFAKGELIWIAESDDYNELTFLEELISEWNKHKNVVVAFSNYVIFCRMEFSLPKERKSQCFNGKSFVKNRMARVCAIHNASGAIFSKVTYTKIAKRFLNFKSAGDYMFWTEILLHGNVAKVNKNLTYWRHHISSVTSNSITTGLLAREDKRVFDFIIKFYGLNYWQKYIAKSTHISYYLICNFENKRIQQEILDLWDLKFPLRANHFIYWLIGAFERHLDILV